MRPSVLGYNVMAVWCAWSSLVPLGEGGALYGPRDTCYLEEDPVLYSAPSKVLCGAICLQLKGLAFTHVDDSCEVQGVGKNPAVENHFLRLPPLTETNGAGIVEASPAYSVYYLADYAIDTNLTTYYKSAEGLSSPWWLLDMGKSYLIQAVEILPVNLGLEAFHDTEIRVGASPRIGEDFSGWTLLARYNGPYEGQGRRLRFTCFSPISGRYVVLQKVVYSDVDLRIADVKVFVKSP